MSECPGRKKFTMPNGKRSKAKAWEYVKSLSKEEFELYRSENPMNKGNKTDLKQGYTCIFKNCKYEESVKLPADTFTYELFRFGIHDHSGSSGAQSSAFKRVQPIAIAALQNGMRGSIQIKNYINNQMGHSFLQRNLVTDVQIRNLQQRYTSKLNEELGTKTNFNVYDLKRWIQTNSVIPHPDEAHKSYVALSSIDETTFNDSVPKVKYFVTTRTLASIGLKSTQIHLDATYKLIWQGYPVLPIGVTDSNRRFHVIGYGITSTDENSSDFLFLLEGVRKAIFNATGTL